MIRSILLLITFLLAPCLQAEITFLTISDIHYGQENHRIEGQDTDPPLLSLAMKKMQQLSRSVDFIITLGDFPTHLLGYSSKRAGYIKTVFHTLSQADSAGKPLFFVTGNNDSLQGNYQSFFWKGHSVLSLAPDWKNACIHCDTLLVDPSHLWQEGYYSSYVRHGDKNILLIVLNSSQFANPPFWIPKYPNQRRAARAQLHWFAEQLATHHAKQLLIALHIPPGHDHKGRLTWQAPFQKEFIHLLRQASPRYGEISLLTAHTHMDDIRKIQLDHQHALYAYATPSISPIHHNHSAMKIFTLNKNDQITNYTTYYTPSPTHWGTQHYQARADLFPTCHAPSLAACLDALSPPAVCEIFKAGLFYGAKSPRVDASVCRFTYVVN